ncbi:MAG: hypothetical protein ACYDCJ_13660 [Gammaproteobacteria bacterium]
MSDYIGSPQPPLQAVIPSYLYQQYADDENLQAFVDAYNTLAQGYLSWFNAAPLALYTSPQISGPLLDWVATGIYGVKRPVFSSHTTQFIAGLNSAPLNTLALNGNEYFQSGTATVATDDFYKRVLTWTTYIGDGRHFNVEVLRKKIARFLYGVNGTDITLDQAQSVNIKAGLLTPPAAPVLSSVAGGTLAASTYSVQSTLVSPVGEGLASTVSTLAVAVDYLLTAASPAAENGATGWNLYASTSGAPTKQNASPIPIGTNWTEPTTGLIAGAALPVTDGSNTPTNLIITVPAGTPSTYFEQALDQGLLAYPFMLQASVIVA